MTRSFSTSSLHETMASSDLEYWIYHERQEAMLCGQHTLNNLVQACSFSADSLANFAHQLDQMELAYMAENNEGGVR
jgi:ataxin-3